VCSLHVIIEDYTEIFYMIDEGALPSMSLRGPKPVRKVDGLSLVFIDFFVPALTALKLRYCFLRT
jgi:hypothetical protein